MKKTTIDAEAALREVAKQNHTTVEEVKKEILFAMQASMDNPDPAIQAIWRTIPCVGSTPTPEEFIVYIANRVKAQEALENRKPIQ